MNSQFPGILHVRHSFLQYLKSPSTGFGLCIGALMFASYGLTHGTATNLGLIFVCLFVAFALPLYARLSNKLEERVNFRTAAITAGRAARFLAQFAFNAAAFWILQASGALREAGMAGVGGTLGAAFLTTAASQGAQYIGIFLFNRGYGDLNRNVQLGLSMNVVATALGTAGLPVVRELLIFGGIALGALVFSIGLASDLRGVLWPRGGIAVFFGTFNPFHKTHLALVRRALAERGVEKVVIHPTVLPRFHRMALARGEIAVTRIENGFQVMERTAKADRNVDYFPTGNKFLPAETRRHLIALAVEEAGLSDRVEVAFYPDIYAQRGFHGVLHRIRNDNPAVPIHGIHGSDYGGMLVRPILDECGWIYPLAVCRRDAVSATAIRAGARDMTCQAVAQVLAQLNESRDIVTINRRRFENDSGLLRAI